MFSVAQFEALIREIEKGMKSFETHIARVVPTAKNTNWGITPPSIVDAIVWIAEKTAEVAKAIFDWFLDLLKGATAPIHMAFDAWDWNDVKGKVNGVSTDLTTQNLMVDDAAWSGRARDAYLAAAEAQSTAAARIGTIAGTTSGHLVTCAIAGAVFYIMLAAVLVNLTKALLSTIATIGTGVLSPLGVMIFLSVVGVSTAMVTGALLALTAFLGSQVTAMVALHGEAEDPTAFPGRVWPKSNTALYSDATVKDGDADWSLKEKD